MVAKLELMCYDILYENKASLCNDLHMHTSKTFTLLLFVKLINNNNLHIVTFSEID